MARDLRDLIALASDAGITVRAETFTLTNLALVQSGRGGMCTLGGRRFIFVDAALRPVEQAGIVAEALSQVDLSGLPIPIHVAPYLKTGHAAIGAGCASDADGPPVWVKGPLRPLAFARR